MRTNASRSEEEIERIISTYGDLLFRTALVMLGSREDAEDVLQETVLKYLQKAPAFSGPKHEKAWLIKVAANQCRDALRFRRRHPQISLEEWRGSGTCAENSGILDALAGVPEKYRIVLLLYYVEEYSMGEIAAVIGRSVSAVKMRLKKGRELLEEEYRKGDA